MERMLAGMAVLVAALVLVGMGVIVFVDLDDSRGGGDRVARSRSSERSRCGRAHEPPASQIRADEGRYAVAIPQGWDGRARGSVVKLWDEASRARLAVGLAPSGALTSALLDVPASIGPTEGCASPGRTGSRSAAARRARSRVELSTATGCASASRGWWWPGRRTTTPSPASSCGGRSGCWPTISIVRCARSAHTRRDVISRKQGTGPVTSRFQGS